MVTVRASAYPAARAALKRWNRSKAPEQSATVAGEVLLVEDARPAGAAVWSTLRVEAGRPAYGVDMDDGTIPIEAGVHDRGIDYGKGCYTGQEVIIRILHRGHVNWLLRGLLLGDVPAPAQGAPLVRAEDGRQVGRVTSSVWSPRYGQTIGLAYVRREVEPGGTLFLGEAAGPPATVTAVPFPA